jgi:hypothetical protein
MPEDHDPSHAASAPTDAELNVVVADLQRSIQEWATRHELWFDCGFRTFADQIDRQPGETPVVTILHFDGDLGRALDGDFGGLDMESSSCSSVVRAFGMSGAIAPASRRYSTPVSIMRLPRCLKARSRQDSRMTCIRVAASVRISVIRSRRASSE